MLIGRFLRRGHSTCDVTLKARDGREFKAHWDALADFAEYFRAMRRCEMTEVTTGFVKVEADGDAVEFVLGAMVYGEAASQSPVGADLIRGALLVLAPWDVSGTDALQWWDGDTTSFDPCNPSDAYIMYGWAVSNRNRKAADRLAQWITEFVNKDFQFLEIGKVDAVGMWAIELRTAAARQPKLSLAFPNESLNVAPVDLERRKEAAIRMRGNWEREGREITGAVGERLMRLLGGEEILDEVNMMTEDEFKELFKLARGLGLGTEFMESYACKYGESTKVNLLVFSAEIPDSHLGQTLVRTMSGNSTVDRRTSSAHLGVHYALQVMTPPDGELELRKCGVDFPFYWKLGDSPSVKIATPVKFIEDMINAMCCRRAIDDGCGRWLKSVTSASIMRFENKELWSAYEGYKNKLQQKISRCPFKPLSELSAEPHMRLSRVGIEPQGKAESDLDKTINEVYLFHGTTKKVAELIRKQGFDNRVASDRSAYGAGTYFADRPCMAAQCAFSSHGFILISRVLMGDIQDETRLFKVKRRPDVNPKSGEPYDSVLGDCGGHKEYVVYDRSQAYPEYCIKFS